MPDTRSDTAAMPMALLVAASVALIGMIAISIYELSAFGWHPAREEPAHFSAYHCARMLFSMLLAAYLVAVLAAPWRRAGADGAKPLDPTEIRNGALTAAMAALAVAILAWNPPLFHWFAREDNILEWVSAVFVLAGAVFLALAALHRARAPFGGFSSVFAGLLMPAGFAGLYFLIGMEEISWGQRIFGFETPDGIAARNWQSEFNFHNLHTDISELAYYFGTGLFLIALPLAKPALRHWKPASIFADFFPNRAVAALSAPMVVFSYGHWSLVPIQVLTFLTLFAMLVFALSARRNGKKAEAALFAGIAALIGAGQVLILYLGPNMLDLPDATEFRELFISIGLFAFAAYYYFGAAQAEPAPKRT